MVDIHSHILPGLDDGARTLEDSVEMMEMAAETGTTDIVATPHADFQFRYHPGLVRKLIGELQKECASPRIHCGCDFHLHAGNVEDALLHPDRYTVNGLRYLLVELDDEVIHADTPLYFDRLEGAGMKIILTHPERNPRLRESLETIEQWVAQGRLMQITAQSLLGRFGPQAASFSRQMLDRGLAHFVASDAHNAHDRVPVLQDARAWVDANYSEALGKLLFEIHPRAVIEGRNIELGGFPPRRKSLWSRFFSRG